MVAHARNLQTPSWSLSIHLEGKPLSATCPPESFGLARDEVKLLVLDKRTGLAKHTTFRSLSSFLKPGDVLVVNNSQTVPAKIPVTFGGQRLCLHLAARLSPRVSIVERRTAGGAPDDALFSTGDTMRVDGAGEMSVIGRFHPQSRLWYVESDIDLYEVARQIGRPIQYGYLECEPSLADFQTIFATTPGSSEMPSAARPFSQRVLDDLRHRGVEIQEIILHTGVSSHEVVDGLDNHPFLPEWFRVSDQTAKAVNEAKAGGRRIIAAGTTVVRALETVADHGRVVATSGWTTHIVTPETPPQIVTGLISGLHESDTSHLALMYAFISQDYLTRAYNEAINRDYRWHEFGDSNLIL